MFTPDVPLCGLRFPLFGDLSVLLALVPFLELGNLGRSAEERNFTFIVHLLFLRMPLAHHVVIELAHVEERLLTQRALRRKRDLAVRVLLVTLALVLVVLVLALSIARPAGLDPLHPGLDGVLRGRLALLASPRRLAALASAVSPLLLARIALRPLAPALAFTLALGTRSDRLVVVRVILLIRQGPAFDLLGVPEDRHVASSRAPQLSFFFCSDNGPTIPLVVARAEGSHGGVASAGAHSDCVG